MAQVLPPSLHRRLPPRSTENFFRDFKVPELQARLSNRILAAHASLHFLLSGHCEVCAYLLIQFLVHLFPSEQRSQSARYVSQQGHAPLRRLQDSSDRRYLSFPFSCFSVEPLSSPIC